jgi:hypothetical protein
MYLWVWVRRAALVSLGLLAVLAAGLVVASIGSQSAAAQDQMAASMYVFSPGQGLGDGTSLLVPTHTRSGTASGSTAAAAPAAPDSAGTASPPVGSAAADSGQAGAVGSAPSR